MRLESASNNNTIEDNQITKYGKITVDSSSNTVIRRNIITQSYGISLSSSHNNIIEGNYIAENSGTALSISGSENTMSYNYITKNTKYNAYGITLPGRGNKVFPTT